MTRTSYQEVKTLEDDYKEAQKHEWRRDCMVEEQMTEEVPKSSGKGSDTLGGMFR